MPATVLTEPKARDEARKTPPLSDELLSRAIDDLCLTASRAHVDLSVLLDVLPGLAKFGKGSAAALVRVVERMQQTSTSVDAVTHCLEDRFPDIDQRDRQARERLSDLNAETKTRFGGGKVDPT